MIPDSTMTTRVARLSKGKHGKWTSADMSCALESLSNGTGLNAAARAFGVPKATLKRHLTNSNKTARGNIKRLGRTSDLPPELEDQLVKHILQMEAMFYGFSTKSLRKLAFQIADINKIANRFNKEQEEAGKEWLAGFLKRHPEISVRSPQSTSLARASAFNRKRVGAFFDLLEKLVEEHGFTADRIYNTDEKGLTAVQKPGKVLAKKGKSQVGSVTSAEKGANVTFVCCMSASGHFIPPMAVFPRKRMNPQLEDGAPPGTLFKCQENGWMTVDLFGEWMAHFITFAKPDPARKVLLIVDGHVSHTQNLKALLMAREAGVIMLSLPSHTTHRMQPLDVAFFRPLSIYYGQEADKWMRHNPGRPLTHFQVCRIFGIAYHRAASLETAANGFRNAGIWPVDRHVFKDCDFAPSDVTHVEQPSVITSVNMSIDTMTTAEEGFVRNAVPHLPFSGPSEPASTLVTLAQATSHSFADGLEFVNATDSIVAVEYVNIAAVTSNHKAAEEISISPVETTHSELTEVRVSSDNPLLEDSNDGTVQLTKTQHSDEITSLLASVVDQTSSSSHSKSPNEWISVQAISPPPHRTSDTKKRRGNTMEATILTGSPYKIVVEERQAKQNKRDEKIACDKKKQLHFETAGSGIQLITKTSEASSRKSKRVLKRSKACATHARKPAQQQFRDDSTTYHCLVCGETYDEAWIQCEKCKLWAHEACADLSHSEYYFCDNCSVLMQSKCRKLN